MSIDGPIAPDLYEDNDSLATAWSLTPVDQTLADLSIDQADDDDYFQLVAYKDGTLTVDALFSHAVGDLDFEILDANGIVLASSFSTSDNEQASVTMAAGETCVIRVFGFGGDIHGCYDLVIDVPDNVAPVADGGADQTGFASVPLTLDGSGSSDADAGPFPLFYMWSIVSGPVGHIATFGDEFNVTTSFSADFTKLAFDVAMPT